MNAPQGRYPSADAIGRVNAKMFKATGEWRSPRKGEFYLSGAVIEAYRAPNDLAQRFWIAKEIVLVPCEHCNGTGKVEQKRPAQLPHEFVPTHVGSITCSVCGKYKVYRLHV